MQLGEKTIDGEGIQAGDRTGSRRKGWPWKAAGQERPEEAVRAAQGCGQVMLAVQPLKAEFLHGFLMESVNRTALLSPATFLNENQLLNIMSPSFPKPRLRQGNQTLVKFLTFSSMKTSSQHQKQKHNFPDTQEQQLSVQYPLCEKMLSAREVILS